MTLSNVALTDTFDVWRTRTNQLVVRTNAIDASPVLYFTSNSSSLTLTSNAFRKGNVYFQLSTNSDFNNTQTNTVATSKAVNDTYLTVGSAFNKANAANLFAFNVNITAAAAYTQANDALVTASAAFALANAAGAAVYSDNVGNSVSNTFTINHGLNKEFVNPVVRENSSGYYVYPDMRYVDLNTIILEFVSAPSANQYKVIVVG